jgi:hypothetical protein
MVAFVFSYAGAAPALGLCRTPAMVAVIFLMQVQHLA